MSDMGDLQVEPCTHEPSLASEVEDGLVVIGLTRAIIDENLNDIIFLWALAPR